VIVNDVQDLLGLFIKTKSSDGVNKFFRGNIATTIIVENIEAFLDFGDITFRDSLL
jgi:hypothetical protein